MPAKLFVGNLSFQATEEDLRELFQQAGTVESVRIVTDQFTGRPRGFGFVEMATKEEAAKAVEMLNGRLFRDRNLVVDEARPQPQRGAGGGGPARRRRRWAAWRRAGRRRGKLAPLAKTRPRGRESRGLFLRRLYSTYEDYMNKPGVPAPGFVKRIGPIVDERRSVEFRPLESSELVNRLSDPRLPFGWTVNPFRGCEFGCRYCYARPTHGYLGHADPAEFERRIYVKQADEAKLVSPAQARAGERRGSGHRSGDGSLPAGRIALPGHAAGARERRARARPAGRHHDEVSGRHARHRPAPPDRRGRESSWSISRSPRSTPRSSDGSSPAPRAPISGSRPWPS